MNTPNAPHHAPPAPAPGGEMHPEDATREGEIPRDSLCAAIARWERHAGDADRALGQIEVSIDDLRAVLRDVGRLVTVREEAGALAYATEDLIDAVTHAIDPKVWSANQRVCRALDAAAVHIHRTRGSMLAARADAGGGGET